MKAPSIRHPVFMLRRACVIHEAGRDIQTVHPLGPRILCRACRARVLRWSSPSTPAPPGCGPSPSTTRGRPVGSAYREFTQHFPTPGLGRARRRGDLGRTQDGAGPGGGRPRATPDPTLPAGRAIGITNQRETVVAWDRRTGQPLHRAIVWQDRRTAEPLRRARRRRRTSTRCGAATGLVLDPYFSATKIEWLLTEGGVDVDDRPRARAPSTRGCSGSSPAARCTPPSPRTPAARCSTTSGPVAGPTSCATCSASPDRALPEVRPSRGRFGATVDRRAGIGSGIPITGIAGDQQAALFGQACFEPGMAKNTYGTGSFVLMNVGDRCPEPVEGLLTTVAWDLPGDPGGGRRPRHPLRARGRHLRRPARRCSGCATASASSPTPPASGRSPLGRRDSDGVVLVPAFTGLGSPWWDPYARGTVLGITRGTGRAHLARAVVEAMAFQTRDVVDAMAVGVGHPVRASCASTAARRPWTCCCSSRPTSSALPVDPAGRARRRPRSAPPTSPASARVWSTARRARGDVPGARPGSSRPPTASAGTTRRMPSGSGRSNAPGPGP